jgi:E3 ubiquitin-protein ligase synoviolin
MNFWAYFFLSILSVLITVYYSYYTYKEFYPIVLFLVSSKVSFIIVGNMIFALSLLLAKVFKVIFFGTLRSAEVELLIEKAKYTIPETCLALTIFRNELTTVVLLLFASVIYVKLFHRLTKFRLEYLEQIMPISIFAQLQVLSLITFLILVDIVGTISAIHYVKANGKSVIMLFAFEFGLLFIYSINLASRFIIQLVDSMYESGLTSKGLYLMITDLICEIVKFLTYFCFFYLIFSQYGLPIHILRDVWGAFNSCQRKFLSFVQYLRLTRNLDARFENATAEELQNAGSCLVCRESMDQGKKLPCGHVFHMDCLRMWLQHQQTCPLCR